MAKVLCLTHAPVENFDRNYVNTLPYEEDHCCEVARCAGKPVIWLNPEEVRAHERGTRLFQNNKFDNFKTQDTQVKLYTVNPISAFVRMLKKQFAPQTQKAILKAKPALNNDSKDVEYANVKVFQ